MLFGCCVVGGVWAPLARASANLNWGVGSVAPVPANAGAPFTDQVSAVSCASAGNCTAVGAFSSGANRQGLLLTEVSGTWGTGVEATLPADASTSNPNVALASVSCASAGNCTAVGTYIDNAGNVPMLLLTESSGIWGTGVEATLPAGARTSNQHVSVNSVSCGSAGSCTAVGSYEDSSGNSQGLLLSESSGAWGAGVEATPPAGASSSNASVSVNSVSCGSAGDCTAVGSYEDSSGNSQGLLLGESSGTWATGVEATPPAGAGANPQLDLGSVSCTSAGNCTAVGNYIDSSGHRQGGLLSASSGTWATGVEAALPSDANRFHPNVGLASVSCGSAGNCSAVGTYTDSLGNSQGLLLSESSGTWATGAEATLPAGASSSNAFVSVNSVSCGSAGNCSAVGTYTDSSGNGQGLLLSESSGTWATGAEATLPAGASTSQRDIALSSVSCASAGNCSAVGTYDDSSGNGQGLLLGESSGTWATGVEATLPAGASSSNPNVSLRSVSCASAGNCTAVGSYIDSSGNVQGLLLTESSGVWGAGVEATLPAGASSSGPNVSLRSVSCASAGNCTAVGSYIDSSGHPQGLLVSESSGAWGAGVEATLPADASTTNPGVSLNSVSCASAGSCTAVGGYFDNSGNLQLQGLLLTESSGAWGAGVEATLPAGASTSTQVASLGSVSCASAGNCSAVGTYNDSSSHQQGLLLTEASGAWGAGVEASLPAGAEHPSVNSVSCTAGENCTAVGAYTDSSGNVQGLSLTESSGTWATGVETTLPGGASTNPQVSLNSVSCASAGNCAAVGRYSSGANRQALLVTEASGTWGAGVQGTLPAGATTSGQVVSLGSVSCAAAGNCSAAGTYIDGSGNVQGLFLTEASGTWATGLEATLPAGATSSGQVVSLGSPGSSSVSCASVGNCTAVGSYADTGGNQQGVLMSAAPASPALSAGAPSSGTAGSAIAASTVTGTLSGGVAPTGTVTFTVFGPQASPPALCTSGGAIVGTLTVNGNGTYNPSAGFTPPSAGDYWWYASYGGDSGDNPAASSCGAGMAETVVSPPDTSAPSISIITPASGATYTQGQVVRASYACTDRDGTADVAKCAGPVVSGGPIDTSILGPHTFAVSAADQAGNNASRIVSYTVVSGSSALKLVGSPKSTGNGVTFRLICSAPAGHSCQTTDTLTSTETLRRSRPVAVGAAQKAKSQKLIVVVGGKRMMIPAGTTKTVTITLNAQGRQLLARFHKLPVTLTLKLTSKGKTRTAVKRALTITPKKKTHRSLRAAHQLAALQRAFGLRRAEH